MTIKRAQFVRIANVIVSLFWLLLTVVLVIKAFHGDRYLDAVDNLLVCCVYETLITAVVLAVYYQMNDTKHR